MTPATPETTPPCPAEAIGRRMGAIQERIYSLEAAASRLNEREAGKHQCEIDELEALKGLLEKRLLWETPRSLGGVLTLLLALRVETDHLILGADDQQSARIARRLEDNLVDGLIAMGAPTVEDLKMESWFRRCEAFDRVRTEFANDL